LIIFTFPTTCHYLPAPCGIVLLPTVPLIAVALADQAVAAQIGEQRYSGALRLPGNLRAVLDIAAAGRRRTRQLKFSTLFLGVGKHA
jgi:hypothetical protein